MKTHTYRLSVDSRLLKLETCGTVFSPYALLTTFEYFVHTTPNSHVDFYGGKLEENPRGKEENNTSNKLNSYDRA